MIWKNPALLGRTWRRNAVTSAVLYGLSLSIRFTSAAGEEIEVPVQAVERSQAMFSIIMNDGEHASEKNWSGRTAVPLASHRGSPKITAGATPNSSNCFPP